MHEVSGHRRALPKTRKYKYHRRPVERSRHGCTQGEEADLPELRVGELRAGHEVPGLHVPTGGRRLGAFACVAVDDLRSIRATR